MRKEYKTLISIKTEKGAWLCEKDYYSTQYSRKVIDDITITIDGTRGSIAFHTDKDDLNNAEIITRQHLLNAESINVKSITKD